MEIKYHKLADESVDFIQSPNGGGVIRPRFIVMHYTAGYTGSSAIQTFKSPASKVSAHLVIDRSGKVTQMMPFNKKAWHAGPSVYKGVRNLNSHSIGIEFVNIGYLRQSRKGLVDAYGNTLSMEKFDDYVIAPHPRVGSGEFYWPVYTEAQLAVGRKITEALIKSYPIEGICSHEEIDTRGWKTDPGPAFPMRSFVDLLGKKRDDEPLPTYEYTVDVSSLNVRAGPGTNWQVIGGVRRGDKVQSVEEKGGWVRIIEGDMEGWVSSRYLARE
ncbi:MAG: N-acetylmuramoyl-L-alanine amidase [Hoeflea sp.]|jgi:N-acetylmuramoyl-L-alanine amidase|uniref:N-acetylmuramoyl-L-alanine amidase n=1 Tax=Hoeflea sp. TaxID=1940281 RepID=UPI0032F077C4